MPRKVVKKDCMNCGRRKRTQENPWEAMICQSCKRGGFLSDNWIPMEDENRGG
jgi:hypothetical protein